MFALLVVAAAIPSMILGYPITGCGGGIPTPTTLTISGCTTSPCQVQHGTSLSYTTGFVPTAASANIVMSIQITVNDETRDLVLPPEHSNACITMSPPCPIVAGQAVTQTGTIPVSNQHEGGTPISLRVAMTNAQGATQACSIINLIVL